MTGDTIAWFSDRGVALKMEDDGRMFPVSDSSQTIIDCFQNEINKHKVKVQLSTEVKSIVEGKDGFQIQTNKESIIADTVVLAVGGNSKVKHYEWIESLGHTISQPIPSLFTFNLKKHASNELMGLAMNASVRIVGTKFEEYGPVLFTHWGMSGPGILKLSAKAAKYLYERSYQFDYEVEWIFDAQDLVDSLRKTNSKMQLSNTKIEGFPNRFWIYLLQKGNL
jgi:predicted Rossmann fold flavoprotein